MTYEDYLDEVTTLLTEMFDMSDAAAIKHVMRAQAADFFTLHDDIPAMRTQERAVQDAKTLFAQISQSRSQARPQSRQPSAPKPRQPGKRKK
ncbi:hypothetical protein FAY22_01975 [Noviherbaspirillum sp. UKPF54]|nr:hypothetical protein [Noviherbaspirillum sp. UKPF54]QDZ30407.1 hypothetical protein FAY22_01975 [Noviherbaspirillum sp. UKPF54]